MVHSDCLHPQDSDSERSRLADYPLLQQQVEDLWHEYAAVRKRYMRVQVRPCNLCIALVVNNLELTSQTAKIKQYDLTHLNTLRECSVLFDVIQCQTTYLLVYAVWYLRILQQSTSPSFVSKRQLDTCRLKRRSSKANSTTA